MANAPIFDDVTGESADESNGSSSSSGPSVPQIPESSVRFLLDALEHKGGVGATVDIHAFAEDAPEMKEQNIEYYEMGNVETLSVEDLFGLDWSEYDFVGTPPVVNTETLTEEQKSELTDDELLKSNGDEKKYVIHPDHAEAFRGANVAKGVITPLTKAINGRYGHLIVEKFGSDAKISVGKGKDRLHGDDPVEARKHVAFQVSDSETADYKREKFRYETGNISLEELEEYAEKNGHEERFSDDFGESEE